MMIIKLLDYWIIGLLDYWIIGLLVIVISGCGTKQQEVNLFNIKLNPSWKSKPSPNEKETSDTDPIPNEWEVLFPSWRYVSLKKIDETLHDKLNNYLEFYYNQCHCKPLRDTAGSYDYSMMNVRYTAFPIPMDIIEKTPTPLNIENEDFKTIKNLVVEYHNYFDNFLRKHYPILFNLILKSKIALLNKDQTAETLRVIISSYLNYFDIYSKKNHSDILLDIILSSKKALNSVEIITTLELLEIVNKYYIYSCDYLRGIVPLDIILASYVNLFFKVECLGTLVEIINYYYYYYFLSVFENIENNLYETQHEGVSYYYTFFRIPEEIRDTFFRIPEEIRDTFFRIPEEIKDEVTSATYLVGFELIPTCQYESIKLQNPEISAIPFRFKEMSDNVAVIEEIID